MSSIDVYSCLCLLKSGHTKTTTTATTATTTTTNNDDDDDDDGNNNNDDDDNNNDDDDNKITISGYKTHSFSSWTCSATASRTAHVTLLTQVENNVIISLLTLSPNHCFRMKYPCSH